MRVFLSGRYESREQLQKYAHYLESGGHEIVSNWLYEDQMDFTGMDNIPNNPGENYAWGDFEDIKFCDVFIAFTEKQGVDKGRGGRHVEYGFAWMLEKPIIIVGPSENVFHAVNASDIWRMEEWNEELITEYMDQIEDYLSVSKPRRR